jgi:hypothetical protein
MWAANRVSFEIDTPLDVQTRSLIYRTAAATLESSTFESAVSEARAKIEVAVDWYEELNEE